MKKITFLIILPLLIALPLFAQNAAPTVYITKSGSKYHTATCTYLRSSSIPIPLEQALTQGYEPCKRCKPPTEVPAQSQQSAVQTTNIDKEALALPYTSNSDVIIKHEGYALLYSEEHEQPYWVAYLLTAEEVAGNIDYYLDTEIY